jgi:hypothetical protein
MTRSTLADLDKQTVARTTALTMGLLAAAAGFAPAALADTPAPAAPATTTAAPDAAVQESAPAVLPPAAATTATTADGPHYGSGKLVVDFAASDGEAPEFIAPLGAVLAVHIVPDGGLAEDHTCTIDELGYCGNGAHDDVSLPADAAFSVTLVTAPTRGGVVMTSPAPTISGHTDPAGAQAAPHVVLKAPGGNRVLGVELRGTGSLTGATFELRTPSHPVVDPDGEIQDLVQTSDEGAPMTSELLDTATTDADGLATFDGVFPAGPYQLVQTDGPGHTAFSPDPVDFPVAPAKTVAERDTPFRAAVLGAEGPVPTQTTPPAPTSSAPAPETTAPVSTPAAATSSAPAVASTTLARGATQTITLTGFQPHEMVHGVLHSTPVDLGTVEADAAGTATFTFTVPAGLETGTHSVTMTGLTSGTELSATFTVTAAATAGGLAYTGTEVMPLAATGGALLLAGVAVIGLVRRRRTA